MLNKLKLPIKLVLALLIYWIMQTIADVASVYFNPQYDTSTFNWNFIWIKKTSTSFFYFLTYYLAFVWYQKHTITLSNWKKSLTQLLLSGLVWLVIFDFYFSLVHIHIMGNTKSFVELFLNGWGFYSVYNYFGFIAVAVVPNAYYYYQEMTHEKAESAQLQLKLANTRLMLYRAQLEPHFLFNALNSIASLVRLERKEQATDALNQLSTLLRSVVEIGNNQLMPLNWELEFTRHYASLQTLRFGKKLIINIEAKEIDERLKVPVMLIQPFIENAINHGSLSDSEVCKVDVTLIIEDNRFCLTTSNKIARKKNTKSSGVGLQNMRNRLHALYRSDFNMTAQENQGLFVVTVHFPVIKDIANNTQENI